MKCIIVYITEKDIYKLFFQTERLNNNLLFDTIQNNIDFIKNKNCFVKNGIIYGSDLPNIREVKDYINSKIYF
jgi:hypothetical protein